MKLIPWTNRDVARPLGSLQRHMNRLFDEFFGRDFAIEPFRGVGEWIPALDIAETDDAIIVKAELPGLARNDVELTLTDDVLTVRGEKKAENEEKTKSFHRVERSYGSFERSVRLSTSVKPDKVMATFKNGVLTVHLPKVEAARTRSVKIKVE